MMKGCLADRTRAADARPKFRWRARGSAGNGYLLIFLLLRWTGMRGSDVVGLQWGEIDWDSREISRLTLKRHKRVIVPIHQELLFALEVERNERKPQPEDRVLLNLTSAKSCQTAQPKPSRPHRRCKADPMRRTPENRRKTGGDNPVSGNEATRWKPGQSGNPGGRPKTAPLSQACREVLARPFQAIAKDAPMRRR